MAHALRQRRAGLLALFDSVGALNLEGTTAHTIALRRQPGAAGVTVPIAQLTAFLRSARLVGGGAMELDEWMLRPLTEVEFLELLMHVRSGAGDEEAAMRQSLQVLNARGYDHLTFEHFEALLQHVAAHTLSRPHADAFQVQGALGETVSLDNKTSALLDYLEVPFETFESEMLGRDQLSARPGSQSQGSRVGSPVHKQESRLGTSQSGSIGMGATMSRLGTPGGSVIDLQRSVKQTSGSGALGRALDLHLRAQSSLNARSARMQTSFIVSRPATRSSSRRPGTAESSDSIEYWNMIMADSVKFRNPKGLHPTVAQGRGASVPAETGPSGKRARATGYGQRGVARQWLQEAIRIINPGDPNWCLTQESVLRFLKMMKVTPESCDILKPGVLADMFAETDLEKNGVGSPLFLMQRFCSFILYPWVMSANSSCLCSLAG